MAKEATYVDRLNSLTAGFRLAVKEVVMRKQIALMKESKKDASDALGEVVDEIYALFPNVEAEK